MKINELIIEKGISVALTVLGSVATAILLWIGSTLQTLTVKMEGVMTRIEANDKTFNEFREQIQIHDYKIDTLDKRVDKLEIKKPPYYYDLYK